MQTLEQLLHKSNDLKNQILEIQKMDNQITSQKPNAKAWSALEVIDHLNKVYDIYLPHFEKALANTPELIEGNEIEYKTSILGKMAIYGSKPKQRKRRFKMKTFDFFQPVEDEKSDVIETFLKNKEAFNDFIKDARIKQVGRVKMPTALGSNFKLYVTECFAFVWAHEERHMIQIDETLESVS